MSNRVVKITRDDTGEKILYAKWCLVDPANKQGAAALCSQQFFGMGESRCEFLEKEGKITCPKCIETINIYKKIKI